MRDVFVLSAARTPIGRYAGALSTMRPDDLLALAIRAAVERAGVDPAAIDDVIAGCANQAGEDNRNVARMAALLAGLPVAVPGATVNRLCGSGLQAIADGARQIRAGEAEVVVAGGVESMTRAPLVMLKPDAAFSRGARELVDTTIGWRFVNPRMAALHPPISMGETAERVAAKEKVSRADQDAFALESQRRAGAAMAAGRFADELVPVAVPEKGGTRDVIADEHPRPETTIEQLTRLRPAFAKDGTVTAGNASGVNDGAAAVVLVSEKVQKALGRAPLGRVVGAAVAGVEPALMGLGPIPATHKALARAGWRSADLDLCEVNEAFAAQAIPCLRQLELDPERVNVNGGAIALGHPLGASGARMTATLLHELGRRNGKRALATMCIGVGQGIAVLFER